MSERGFTCIALDSPKCEANVGGALRAAYCYGASLVVLTAKRIVRMPTDTYATHRHIPLLACDDVFDAIPHDCVPVAIEFIPGAIPLPEYRHPQRAFYVFGGEDATLGERVLSRCRDVVMIPTTRCMNLAATVNVVLYDRMTKAAQITRQLCVQHRTIVPRPGLVIPNCDDVNCEFGPQTKREAIYDRDGNCDECKHAWRLHSEGEHGCLEVVGHQNCACEEVPF